MTTPPPQDVDEALEQLGPPPTKPVEIALEDPIGTGDEAVEAVTLAPLTWGQVGGLRLTFSGLLLDDLLALTVQASSLTPLQADMLSTRDLATISRHLSINLACLMRGWIRAQQAYQAGAGRSRAAQLIEVATKGLPGQAKDVPLQTFELQALTAGHIRGIGLDLGEMTQAQLREVAGRASGQPDAILKRLELPDAAEVVAALVPFLLQLRGI